MRTVQAPPATSFVAVESVKGEKKTSAPKLAPKPAKTVKKQSAGSSVLQEIAKNLQELKDEKPAPSKSNQIVIPTLQKTAPIAQEVEWNEGEKLVAYLQNMLDLPEMGEVKMVLVLTGSGRLVSCEIIEAQSKKNGEFLKKQLPELAFPCFNPLAKADEIFQFTVTFKNAENR